MENIKMIKGEDGSIYLHADDLVRSFLPRVVSLEDEIKALDGKKESSIVGLDGKVNMVDRTQEEVYEQHQLLGMHKMLKGVIGVLTVSEDDINV